MKRIYFVIADDMVLGEFAKYDDAVHYAGMLAIEFPEVIIAEVKEVVSIEEI